MSADLYQLIRDVSGTLPDAATPADIAQAVIDKAGDDLAKQFLLELITAMVGDVLRLDRRAGLNAGRHSGSKKVARRRDWWARTLQTRVAVGGGQWKRLGECTVDDLRHCILERQLLITQIEGQISNYGGLIASMEKHGVAVVGELTEDQVNL